ncbi:MAG: hypothetical protein JF615_02815 [Asticcacaulis sp.]|nr:hypothetical protein [Asticcacaulis sp.]
MPALPVTKPLSVYKRDAARLLKALRAGEPDAETRFGQLHEPPAALQLKHALAVVAHEAGFDSWTALKKAGDAPDFSDIFARPGVSDSLNAWFASYDEARTYHQSHGGVLLPYRHQIFVTSMAVLIRMGFEADHPDWKAIGYDFVRPASSEAYSRIKAALLRRFGD